MTSILTSTKKLAGMTEEYKAYDDQIIMYINSTLLRLKQIGVGPSEGFVVTGSSETWEQFIPYDKFLRESAKAYMGAKVRMQFDPPTASSALEALKEMIREYEWCLNAEADTKIIETNPDGDTMIGTVVNCVKLVIRAKPDYDAEIIGEVANGSKVVIDEYESNFEFYKIVTTSGLIGYCDRDYIEIKN